MMWKLRAISPFLENRGEEHKISKRVSLNVSVTCERLAGPGGLVRAALFWKSHCATCSYIMICDFLPCDRIVQRAFGAFFAKKCRINVLLPVLFSPFEWGESSEWRRRLTCASTRTSPKEGVNRQIAKTMQFVSVLDLPLVWKPHSATCSQACVILYHVTVQKAYSLVWYILINN